MTHASQVLTFIYKYTATACAFGQSGLLLAKIKQFLQCLLGSLNASVWKVSVSHMSAV